MASKGFIELAEAQKELQRIDSFLSQDTLLVGGLAVHQYCPQRRSRDIDIVTDDECGAPQS